MSLLIEAAVTIRVLFAIYSHLRREKFRRAHFCTACIKSIRKFTFSPTARLERHRNSTFRTSYILTYYLHKTHAAVALSLVARALRDAEIRCVWISSGVGGAGDSRASNLFLSMLMVEAPWLLCAYYRNIEKFRLTTLQIARTLMIRHSYACTRVISSHLWQASGKIDILWFQFVTFDFWCNFYEVSYFIPFHHRK